MGGNGSLDCSSVGGTAIASYKQRIATQLYRWRALQDLAARREKGSEVATPALALERPGGLPTSVVGVVDELVA